MVHCMSLSFQLQFFCLYNLGCASVALGKLYTTTVSLLCTLGRKEKRSQNRGNKVCLEELSSPFMTTPYFCNRYPAPRPPARVHRFGYLAALEKKMLNKGKWRRPPLGSAFRNYGKSPIAKRPISWLMSFVIRVHLFFQKKSFFLLSFKDHQQRVFL